MLEVPEAQHHTGIVKVSSMDPRLSFVTLVVRDLDASRRFYLGGLG
ncbi:MAG TPA: hypothetical protein PLO27_01640 [Marmoricola sp.]|nr:hypothetical protein [Marmoricola sp.]